MIHWRSHDARLLAPFYTFVLHTDEVADRYYKRLMRDLVHYPEEVYCKASQVQREAPGSTVMCLSNIPALFRAPTLMGIREGYYSDPGYGRAVPFRGHISSGSGSLVPVIPLFICGLKLTCRYNSLC